MHCCGKSIRVLPMYAVSFQRIEVIATGFKLRSYQQHSCSSPVLYSERIYMKITTDHTLMFRGVSGRECHLLCEKCHFVLCGEEEEKSHGITLPLTSSLHPFPSRLFGSWCLTDSGDQHREPDAAKHGLDAGVGAGGRGRRAPGPRGGLQAPWSQRAGLRDTVRHMNRCWLAQLQQHWICKSYAEEERHGQRLLKTTYFVWACACVHACMCMCITQQYVKRWWSDFYTV